MGDFFGFRLEIGANGRVMGGIGGFDGFQGFHDPEDEMIMWLPEMDHDDFIEKI